MSTASNPKVAYSIPEAIAATGIKRTTLYAEMKAGRLRATKVRGRTIIRAEALGAWLAALDATKAA